MTLEWDENSEAYKSGHPIDFPPRASTIQTERFCPVCKNPKSRIDSLRHIKKIYIRNIKKYNFLLNHIKEKKLDKFTIRELIQSLGENITDGSLQQKQLSVLILLGYVEKEIEEWRNKKGKIKMRYVFSMKENIAPPSCYNSEKDRHLQGIEWERKTYFDSKAQK